MTEMKPCRVALVGAGKMAREHIRAFADVPGVIVAGLHSRTKSRAAGLAQEFGIAGVFDSVQELHDGTKADLVVVAVDELSARSVCEQCFAYAWTVLMEKPPGYDLEDAEAILRSAETMRARAFVGLNRRAYDATERALSDLSGNHARRFVYVQDQQDIAQATALGHPAVVVRNWMYANSIHLVDYLRIFGRGRVRRVERVIPWNPETPWTVVSRVDFESGDVGLYECVWNSPGPWAVSVTTLHKRWELRPLERAAFQRKGERKLEAVEGSRWDEQFKPGFRRQAEMAVEAVRGGNPPLSTLEDAVETMRLVRDIYAAAS